MFSAGDSSSSNANREESKKNAASKESKTNPTSGGAAKKRLKSKKSQPIPKGHTSESVDDRLLSHQQQLFQFSNNAHH